MPGGYSYSQNDYAKEPTTTRVHTITWTAGNFDTLDGQADALSAAIAAVSLGSVFKDTRTAEVIKSLREPAANPAAQRELKWLVRGYDSVTFEPWSIEIGCADTSLLDPNNLDRMDPDAAEYTALVTALEDLARSNVGNVVVVQEIVIVGRSN